MERNLDNVTVRVTIEVLKKNPHSWNDADTLAKSVIEDVSSMALDEISGKISQVVNDAEGRVQVQLNNTKRIKELEHRNRMLADAPAPQATPEPAPTEQKKGDGDIPF
jgi:gas vesicle protein